VPARIIGLYALACMEREGPIYGYFVSRRISERTGGAWKPGAGAVYPALRTLVERGLARRSRRGRRLEYRITPSGAAVLRRVRRESRYAGRSAPDLSVLWADVVGSRDPGPFLLQRLRRSVHGLEAHLGNARESPARRSLRREAIRELDAARSRIAASRNRAGARSGGSR